MSDRDLPLWNKEQTDILPEYRLTYGRVLLRGLIKNDWQPVLFKSLGFGKPSYSGPLDQIRLPVHAQTKGAVLGNAAEAHLIAARMADVWTVFAGHDLFFSSARWTEFNKRVGKLMAYITQMTVDSFGCLIFEKDVKQTNVFIEGPAIRVVNDPRIVVSFGDEKIYEDNPTCSLSDAEMRDFVEHDLAIHVTDGKLSIVPRFPDPPKGAAEDVTHFIFERVSAKKSFLGVRWG